MALFTTTSGLYDGGVLWAVERGAWSVERGAWRGELQGPRAHYYTRNGTKLLATAHAGACAY
jgi:hypothetical protein